MSDVVERLRQYVELGGKVYESDATEAADEIERLRQQLDGSDADYCAAIRRGQSMRAEIERLRGLLRELADAADDVGIRHFDHDSLPKCVVRMQEATLAARAALSGADQPTTVPAPDVAYVTEAHIQSGFPRSD